MYQWVNVDWHNCVLTADSYWLYCKMRRKYSAHYRPKVEYVLEIVKSSKIS